MIIEKSTGIKYGPLNMIIDGGDAGDEYDYSPPEVDKVFTSDVKAKIEILEKGPVRALMKINYALKLPEGLTSDRKSRCKHLVNVPVTFYIALCSGLNRVDVKAVIDNKAMDHRLRISFNTDITVDHHYADTHYYAIKRNNKLPPDSNGFRLQFQFILS